MTIVVHHNPACGTSRNTIELIRASGEEPVIIEYLDEGWTRSQLLALFAAAGLTPREALRTSKSPAEELGLTILKWMTRPSSPPCWNTRCWSIVR